VVRGFGTGKAEKWSEKEGGEKGADRDNTSEKGKIKEEVSKKSQVTNVLRRGRMRRLKAPKKTKKIDDDPGI